MVRSVKCAASGRTLFEIDSEGHIIKKCDRCSKIKGEPVFHRVNLADLMKNGSKTIKI